jgi:hypothetical protein
MREDLPLRAGQKELVVRRVTEWLGPQEMARQLGLARVLDLPEFAGTLEFEECAATPKATMASWFAAASESESFPVPET